MNRNKYMNFDEFKLNERILKAIKLAGYDKPTMIQQEAIPILLEGKDLLGSAQTGTGKTAAFAIPILQQMYDERNPKLARTIKTLVLTPTRELALQIYDNFKIYSKYLNIMSVTIYGGVSQKRSEEHTSELQSRPHLVC